MREAPVRRDTSESSDAAKLVMLHHRRRGWALVLAGSAIGLAVYGGLDANLLRGLTGTAEIVGVIPVFVLLALGLVGLVVVIADTARLHGADETVRMSAKSSVAHYPLYAHAHRFPPRHPASWVAIVFMLLAMTCVTTYALPQEVNAWAYVIGAEHQDTFNPVSYSQSCTAATRMARGAHCTTVTVGYLSSSGARAYWSPQVPLGHPFSVRDPLWAFGTGRNLISGDSSAITDIVADLFFDGVALLLLSILVVLARETSPRRSLRRSAPAAAGPRGVGRTRHPATSHHGSNSRPRVRRRNRR